MTYVAIAIVSIAFVVRGWAGDFGQAEIAAIILTFGNGFNLLAGVASVYCRAIGRPGVEAKYSLALIVGNMALSWPCTALWGIIGAVGSTAAVQVVAGAYFCRMMHRLLPEFDTALHHLKLRRAGLAGLATFGLSTITLALNPSTIWTFLLAMTRLPPSYSCFSRSQR